MRNLIVLPREGAQICIFSPIYPYISLYIPILLLLLPISLEGPRRAWKWVYWTRIGSLNDRPRASGRQVGTHWEKERGMRFRHGVGGPRRALWRKYQVPERIEAARSTAQRLWYTLHDKRRFLMQLSGSGCEAQNHLIKYHKTTVKSLEKQYPRL